MKPYGNSRRDNLTCRYGCCTFGTVKTRHRPTVAKAYIRRARKCARREATKVTTQEDA